MKASRFATMCLVPFLTAAASGQVINQASFNDGDLGGWYVNGNQMLFDSDQGGLYMGVPLMDFWGITLSNNEDPALLGDLTRYGGAIEISVDIRVFNLLNWWLEPMDPGEFPIVLQLSDGTEGPGGMVSVYFEGQGMPSVDAGWVRYTFTIPDPTSEALPPGWAGTGDEELGLLPAGRTYRSVLENVTDLRLTTFRPGYFYVSSFWEVGFDNVLVQVVPTGGCEVDWDGSGSVNSADISAFLSSWLDSLNNSNLNADFDGSGSVNSADISAFLSAWLGALEGGC